MRSGWPIFLAQKAFHPERAAVVQKILIIDDEENIRVVFSMALAASFNVFVAADGSTGLALFKELHPDLVVTDLWLPDMSGIELIQKIRRLDTRTKIILASGAGFDVKQIGSIRQIGADLFLEKPISVLAMEQAINNLLALKAAS